MGTLDPGRWRLFDCINVAWGRLADGLLTASELQQLADESIALQKTVEWTVADDPDVGLRFGLPRALLHWREQNELIGDTYSDTTGQFRVLTFVIPDSSRVALSVFAKEFGSNTPNFRRGYTRLRDDWAVTTGETQATLLYAKAIWANGEVRGFAAWYDRNLSATHSRYINAIVNSLEPIPRRPRPPLAAANSTLERPVERESHVTLSGTGFVVRNDGLVVTNAHVVAGCSTVAVAPFAPATVLQIDPIRDLALLRVPGLFGRPAARLASDDAMLGEDVFAFGFPLSDFLGDTLGFSRGSVSATRGLGGDPRTFRMTAEVQPGNSGGPLLDASGRVVGVVVSKLDALVVASKTGDIPQGMNFAIRASELRAFLEEVDAGWDRDNQPRDDDHRH